jgi:hypothetical protein
LRGRARSRALENLDRGGDPANGLHAKRRDLHELLGTDIGIAADEGAALLGHLLQSIGDMDVCSGCIIRLVDAVFDGLDDDLTGMQADPDLQARVGKAPDRILHRQGSQTTANGMVLMRPRCAEQRHDTVALDLVDDAVVAMNGLLHEVEYRLQPAHREFGVTEAVYQPGRIPNVGEQHRQALALAALATEGPKQTL